MKNLFKVGLGISAACLAIAAGKGIQKYADRKLKEYKDTDEGEDLIYMLNRIAVICPKCRRVKMTLTLEDQVTNEHKCSRCSHKWREKRWGDVSL